ncbi:hypothetical protein ARMGADRAFT_1067709 [Armillaria gallica]|uniref:F-box domain-containing protein n=1 Tax=Armillaria gallica TaxID=47427 RepID=A0A2H3D8A9_ARMGA|nr:hypothetical protein ARMGADRAFT_1067709 [Armillaria gallica]
MAQPTLRDYLHLGANQTFSCHALYFHLQSSHSLLRALGIPRNGRVPAQLIAPDTVVALHIDQPSNLEQDSYFPHVLNRLKDERVPITKIMLGQTNWYKFQGASSLDFSGFCHIKHLIIRGSAFSESHLRSVLSSLPTLRTLELHNNSMQDPPNPVRAVFANGDRPTIGTLALTIGNDTCWTLLDLLVSDRSPLNIGKLERLVLWRARGIPPAGGNSLISRRVSSILQWVKFPFALELDDFKITAPMLPITNLVNIKELTITLGVSNNYYDFNYQMLVWWTETLKNIPGWTKLCKITIKVELGPPTAANAPHPRDLAQWEAFDDALCRIEIYSGLEQLRYSVVPKTGYAGHPGYDCDTMRRWLCLRCLPRARIMYTASEDCDFQVLDWANQEVDVSGYT